MTIGWILLGAVVLVGLRRRLDRLLAIRPAVVLAAQPKQGPLAESSRRPPLQLCAPPLALALRLSPVTPSTAHAARQQRTAAAVSRGREPWSTPEDAELIRLITDDELEDFALRTGRTFNAVVQRQRRPRPTAGVQRTGTGWV